MANNPALTIMQLELALNNMQNTMVDEDGKLALDDRFLALFDELMVKLGEAREIAKNMKT
jgi:hypothetical protein